MQLAKIGGAESGNWSFWNTADAMLLIPHSTFRCIPKNHMRGANYDSDSVQEASQTLKLPGVLHHHQADQDDTR